MAIDAADMGGGDGVVTTDQAAVREVGTGLLSMLAKVPGHAANFRWMGFDQRDVGEVSDGLIDALVAWGDGDAVAARVRSHQEAGVGHVLMDAPAGP